MTQPASRLCCLPLSLVAVGLLVVGCGAQQHVVPWRASLPLELGPPAKRNVPEIPPGARPCSAAQVSLRFGWGPPATGGQEGGSLSVRNVGKRTCIIGGRPELTLPARGYPLDVKTDAAEVPGYPSSGPSWGLRPGSTATAGVYASHGGCLAFASGETSEVIRLGWDGKSIPVRLVVCEHTTSPLLLGLLAPPPLPEPPPTDFPFRAQILGRPHVREGRRLRFVVRLTNTSDRTFRFPYCPSVSFGIDGGDGAGGGTLNCHGVRVIEPRGSVAFEMRSRRPVRFFRPGRHRLSWWFTETPALAGRVGATAAVAIAD